MKNILIIQSNTAADANTLRFVSLLARQAGRAILLADTVRPARAAETRVIAGSLRDAGEENAYKSAAPNTVPVSNIDISGMDVSGLAQLISKEAVWMIVGTAGAGRLNGTVDVQGLLRRIQCPLLLVPEGWPAQKFKRLTYLADLRYCRVEIVRYLSALAGLFQASLTVTHLTKAGLTHMEENYAMNVFDENVRRVTGYKNLFFNYTRERDVKAAADVLVNCLHQDLLAVTANRYHHQGLTVSVVSGPFPADIVVPLLIFPG